MFPKEKITEDFDALADRLLGTPDHGPASRSRRFGLFSRPKAPSAPEPGPTARPETRRMAPASSREPSIVRSASGGVLASGLDPGPRPAPDEDGTIPAAPPGATSLSSRSPT